jgi:hypothetical protein
MLSRSWNLALVLALFTSSLNAAPRYYRSSVDMAFSLLGESPTAGPDDFRVKLLNTVSTETSRVGDTVTARVLAPAEFRGDLLEGSVKYVKKGGKIKGQAVLMFSFEKLQHGEKTIPVKATVQSVFTNDESLNVAPEGILTRGNETPEWTALATTQGALIGGLVDGVRGFGIGAGIGAGAALGLIQFATNAPAVFLPRGTEFIVWVD